MTWSSTDPGAGDMEGLRSAGRALDTAARSLSGAQFDLRSEVGTLTAAAWAGEAGDAWRESAESCVRDLGGAVEAAAAGSRALVRYANEVEEIADQAAQVRARQQDARADLALLLRQQMPTALPTTPVLTPREQQREDRRRQAARDAAQDAVSSVDREMAELVERRVVADAAVRESLGAVEIADWAAIGKASVTAGLTRPGMVGGAATKNVLTSLARDVLDGNGSIDDLMQLVDAWGSDDDVLSAFFRSLGGAGTVALVEVLSGQVYAGSVSEDVAHRHAERLLAAMSVASASWTPGQAQRFTDQMMDHDRWPGAVGFLFSSAATVPMGQSFTVAVADRLDEYERVHGVLPQWQPSDGHVLAHVLFPDRPGRGTEPMSGVLETLGRYPQTALDWLRTGRDDSPFARIDYWVGQRDWSGDGFHGVAALWSGLQQQPGGPLDVTSYDPGAWETLAAVNSAFGSKLVSNPHALPENFSIEGQVHLAVALGQMMPLLAYCAQVNIGAEGSRDNFIRSIYVVDESGAAGLEQRPIPLLSRPELARLFGLAASSGAGREVLTAAVRHSQQGMVDVAVLTSGPSVDSALQTVSALQSLLDGALNGSISGIASRAAERSGALVDQALGVIGLIPVPGSGIAEKIARAANTRISDKTAAWLLEKGAAKAREIAREQVVDAIRAAAMQGGSDRATAGTWAAAATAASSIHEDPRDALKEALSAWTEVLDMSGSSIDESSGNLEEYLNKMLGNFDDVYRGASDAAASDVG